MNDQRTVYADGRRPTAWDHVGGVPGLLQSAVPSLVFVAAHAVTGIGPAAVVAIAAATVMLIARRLRGRTVRPAIGGLVGVLISSALAYRTGDARDFFLPDIWGYAAAAAAAALSVVLRWPLAGVLWSALNGTSMRWRHDRRAMLGYCLATTVAAVAFTTRAATQVWFYQHDQPGTMALLRIALNYPLWVITAAAWAWSIRHARGTA
ncbi:DUF3159 domain-containing protein [Tsukamurella sp. NPDC003166]|uniref:DUF3159 domain-containing protein n=1 Tax=Tsukamurella sp. NPDC003166 TaxID=3154444 RepID=UPI0033A382CA